MGRESHKKHACTHAHTCTRAHVRSEGALTPEPSHPSLFCRHPCPPQELGAAGLTKRPTSCILLLPKPWKESKDTDKSEVKKYVKEYEEVNEKAKSVALVF